MKTTTKIVAATLAIVTWAAAPTVFAHPGMGQGPGMQQGQGMGMGQGMMGHGMGHAMMGHGMGMGPMGGADTPAVAAARLADFKTALKITPAQEPAWQKFEATAKQQAETRQAMHSAMLAQRQEGKAPADFTAQREAMLKLHTARDAARAELLAVLTPEQKALFDRPAYGRRGHQGHPVSWQAPAK
jgi:periplasmic protein CpxP/Spy